MRVSFPTSAARGEPANPRGGARSRGGARVYQGAPDHVTGNRKTALARVKHHVSRGHPQNPDETAKKKRRLQEADPEIGREFSQMTGILMDTLVRVSADLSGIGKAKCAPSSKPLVEQIAHEPFAQLNVGRLVQPDLRDIQDQEGAGNDTEDHELDQESMQVPTLQSIVKWLDSRR